MKYDLTNFNFGERVEQLLKERNITLPEFSARTGIPYQRVRDWAKKGSMPSVLSALATAEFFGLSVERLVYGTSVEPLQPVVEDLQHRIETIMRVAQFGA